MHNLFIYLIFALFNPISAGESFQLRQISNVNAKEFCTYFLTPDRTRSLAEIKKVGHGEWKKISRSVISFGNDDRVAWFKCRIKNCTKLENWVFFSEFHFSDRIDFFTKDFANQEILLTAGAGIPIILKPYGERLDAFPFFLRQSLETEIYLRYESILTKTILFELLPENNYLALKRFEEIFFLSYTVVLITICLMNLFLAFLTKKSLPIFYTLLVASYYFYLLIQNGFGSVYLFPNNPELNAGMVSISAGVSVIFFTVFFQRLLSIKTNLVHFYWIMNGLIIIAFIYSIVSAISLFSLSLLQILGRYLFFFSAFVNFYAGIRIYRQGFRPVIYSIYGFITILIFQSIYFGANLGLLPIGGYYVKFFLPVGHLAEFLFFFVSIALIVRSKIIEGNYIDKSNKLFRNENSGIKKFRLSDAEAESVQRKLISLFEEKKIYQEDSLTLDRVSQILKITRHELSEIINHKYHTNFYGFVNHYRIQDAKGAIISFPEKSILEIAFDSGFNSKSTFNKEFKRFTGKSPKEYRKNPV